MRSGVFAVLVSSVAAAHGLTAQTLSVAQSPYSPNGLWSGTTFGLLLTDDRCSWRWVCTDHLGFGEREVPAWFLAPTGTVYAAALSGLAVSRDRGCSFTRAAAFESTGAADVVFSNGTTFVTTSRFGAENGLARSRDDGASFEWTSLRRSQTFFSAVRVAASRVYVSGWFFDPRLSRLWVSDDGAQTFRAHDVTTHAPHFALHAVDARNADVVWASSSDDSNSPVITQVLRSDDAGRSFQEVFRSEGRVSGLVQQGADWWLALGDRVFLSSSGGPFVAQASPKQRACIGLIDGGPVVCGRVGGEDGFALAALDGGVADALLQWKQVAGPIECPAGSPAREACAVTWPVEQAELGLPVDHQVQCGPAPVPDVPQPRPQAPTGCSTAGIEALAIAVAFFLMRRRRVESESLNEAGP